MRYCLHEIDKHHVVATTVAADLDEALDWFSEKLRLMLTFEGDPVAAAVPRGSPGFVLRNYLPFPRRWFVEGASVFVSLS